MKAIENEHGDLDRQTYRVEEVAKLLGVGRAAAYAAVRQGQLPVVRIGRLVRVPKPAFERWLAGIELKLSAQPEGEDAAEAR